MNLRFQNSVSIPLRQKPLSSPSTLLRSQTSTVLASSLTRRYDRERPPLLEVQRLLIPFAHAFASSSGSAVDLPPPHAAQPPTRFSTWINDHHDRSSTIPIISRRCRAHLRPNRRFTNRLRRSNHRFRSRSPIPSPTDEVPIHSCRLHNRNEEEATGCRLAESRRRAFTTRELLWQLHGRRPQVRQFTQTRLNKQSKASRLSEFSVFCFRTHALLIVSILGSAWAPRCRPVFALLGWLLACDAMG